jgi:ribosome maturation factor RimP
MDIESLKTRIIEAIEPVIKDNFMELVDFDIVPGPMIIRVSIDKTGGNINLDECAEMSRKFGEILDATGLAGDDYTLEVGSPGIFRPLKKKEDFIKYTGQKVKVTAKMKIDNERVFTGILKSTDNDRITVDTGSREVVVDLSNVKKANLEPDVFQKPETR